MSLSARGPYISFHCRLEQSVRHEENAWKMWGRKPKATQRRADPRSDEKAECKHPRNQRCPNRDLLPPLLSKPCFLNN